MKEIYLNQIRYLKDDEGRFAEVLRDEIGFIFSILGYPSDDIFSDVNYEDTFNKMYKIHSKLKKIVCENNLMKDIYKPQPEHDYSSMFNISESHSNPSIVIAKKLEIYNLTKLEYHAGIYFHKVFSMLMFINGSRELLKSKQNYNMTNTIIDSLCHGSYLMRDSFLELLKINKTTISGSKSAKKANDHQIQAKSIYGEIKRSESKFIAWNKRDMGNKLEIIYKIEKETGKKRKVEWYSKYFI